MFDFDGTLTCADSFLRFIGFCRGRRAFWAGFVRQSPWVLAYLLRLYPNWKAKQRIFRHFFGGMSYGEFVQAGRAFAEEIRTFVCPDMLKVLQMHVAQGHSVYIVSASMAEWIGPWAAENGVERVIGTCPEVDVEGRLTGRFASPNCHGVEKVKRLLEYEPCRESYCLYAYGDSGGDKAMLEFADCGTKRKKKWCI